MVRLVRELGDRCGVEPKLEERLPVLWALLLGTISTAEALIELLKSGFVNESFMLIRALLERAINFSYLLIAPHEEFELYVAYGRQKALRMLDRSVNVGSMGYRVAYTGPLADKPEYRELIAMFTGPRGGERTRWSEVSLPDRLVAVHNHSGTGELSLLTYLFMYERASEALHGTFYGLLVDSGFWEPRPAGGKGEDSETAQRGNMATLAAAISVVVHDLLRHSASILAVDDLVEKSRQHRVAIFEALATSENLSDAED